MNNEENIPSQLDEPLCPGSCNGRPDSFTMAECILAGECGCTVKGHEYAQSKQEDEPVAFRWKKKGTNDRWQCCPISLFSTWETLNTDYELLYTRPQPATVIDSFLQQDPSTIPTIDEHNTLLVEQIEELRESLNAHRGYAQELVEDRGELVKALREIREEADTYFMKKQIEEADRILAKYQETDNDTPSR